MTTTGVLPPSMAWLTEHLDSLGKRYTMKGTGHLDGQCPAHDDRAPSFTADWYPPEPPGKAGRVEVDCKAGCSRDALRDALGGTWRNLMDGPSELGHSPDGRLSPASRPAPARAPRPRPAEPPAAGDDGHECRFGYRHPEARHVYTDAAGTVIARLDRLRCIAPDCPDVAAKGKPAHGFVTRHPDGRKGKPRALDGILYRLPELAAAAREGRPIYLAEGEGDADALAAAGVCATSAYGGAARAWHPNYTRRLMGAHVVIVADRDPAGYRRAAAVAAELAGVAESVRVVQAAIDRPGADASDHLAAGLGVADLAPVPAELLADDDGAAERLADDDAPDPDALPEAPAAADRWTTAKVGTATVGRDDCRTYRLYSQGADRPPAWRMILDAAVIFGAERAPVPDPDFPDRAAEDDPDVPLPDGSADVTVRMRRADKVAERVIKAMPSTRAAEMKMLDVAGPTAWLGAVPTRTNRAALFAASLALSEREGRPLDVYYAVTGHYVIGREHVFVAGANALSARGVRDDLIVATDSRLSAWAWPDPLPASEMTDGLAEVTALYDAAEARVMAPAQAAVIRAWLGVYRDPADPAAEDEVSPTPWLTGVTGHGKSSVKAAACNLAAAGLRYNTLPFKAGPAAHGGITGPALERLLFRGRDLCLPFDDLDPSIPPPTARAWQSDFLRRLADQKSRAVAQGRADLRAAMPPRCLGIASGEPLDGEDSAVNRALNLPVDRGTVDLAAMRDLTVAERRMTRARFGAAVAAEMLADYPGARSLLADYRETRRPLFLDGRDASGPVLRGAAVAAELLAAWDVALDLAERRGADPAEVERARQVIERGHLAAWRRHLEIIGASSRSRSFIVILREAMAMGGASMDDAAEPGTPPPDALAAGWEPAGGVAAESLDSSARYRRRGPVVGWQDADGSAWLLPAAATAAARTLAERSGDHWTGAPRTIGETLKSDGLLVTHGGTAPGQDRAAAKLPKSLQSLGLGARAWHVSADAWTPPAGDDGDAPLPPDDDDGGQSAGKITDETSTHRGAENGLFTGPTGPAAGQDVSATGPATGPAPVPTGPASASTGPAAGQDTDGAPITSALTGVPAETAERYPLGAVLLADADVCYLGDGSMMAARDTLAAVLELAAGIPLGRPRLHPADRETQAGVILTPAACERYGIPAEPDPDDDSGRGLALPEDHPAAEALRAAGWKVGQIRTSFRVWRPVPGRASERLDVTLLGWMPHAEALGLPAALLADDPPPASLARRLGRLSALAVPPTWTAGVTAMRLMTAVRPPYRRRHDLATGNRITEPVKGSLPREVRPSIYDAPDSHPVARDRPPGLACREESMNWTRPLDALTDAERAAPWAVTVDLAAAFLAACSRLPLGLTGPREMTAAELAAFNADPAAALHIGRGPHRAGVFVAEVSGLREQLDPRLPCPLAPSGLWPDGPLPLHAPTLRYALEYPGVRLAVSAGAVHDECGPYLDPWAARLGDAYAALLADAGITPDMDPAAFLAAYATAAERAPEAWAVLRAIKALYKAGIGKMRDTRPSTWEHATWRPDQRAEVIARSRTDLHRKVAKVCALTGAAPLAWHHDALTYPAPDASALSVVPWTLDGRQVSGALRIGPRPGWVKHSHSEPMADALACLAEGDNPAIRRELDDDGEDS